VDHRLVRQNYIDRCTCTELALYLFLVTVSDEQGLSYYSDQSLCRRLKLSPLELAAARTRLQQTDLIAYQKPLYQVLSLDPASDPLGQPDTPRSGQAQYIAEVLRRALEGGVP
jgi:hypothetical protein